MILTKNFKYIMGGLVGLIVSISIMLGIFAFSTQDFTKLEIIIPSSLTLTVGESKPIQASTNFKDANLTLITADESIAKFENGNIIALSEGSTILRATAVYEEQVAHSSCVITVLSNSQVDPEPEDPTPDNPDPDNPEPEKPEHEYILNIIPVQNTCIFDNDTLFVEEVAIFQISLEHNDLLLSTDNIKFVPDTNISIEQQMDYYIITASNDGNIMFKDEELNVEFNIKVKKVEKL